MSPEGYSVKNLERLRDAAKRVTNTDNLIREAYQNIRLIACQILHDKFGFGEKRILRVESTINTYMEAAEKQQFTMEELSFFLKDKYGIDAKEEANKVPFRERFALTSQKISAESKQSGGLYLVASIYSYFTLLGVCLKTKFKFSAKQIKEAYGWIRYYINTLSRPKQFDLRMKDIALCLAEECNYCDERFVVK